MKKFQKEKRKRKPRLNKMFLMRMYEVVGDALVARYERREEFRNDLCADGPIGGLYVVDNVNIDPESGMTVVRFVPRNGHGVADVSLDDITKELEV